MYDSPFLYMKRHLQASAGYYRVKDLVREAMQHFDRAGAFLADEAFINAVDRVQLELGYTASDGVLRRREL